MWRIPDVLAFARKSSLPVVALLVVVLGTATAVQRDNAPSFSEAPPASDYEIVGPCVEVDVYNDAETEIAWLARARMGDGEVSETVRTGPVAPGGWAHLHMFGDQWRDRDDLADLWAREAEYGCTLEVRIDVDPPAVGDFGVNSHVTLEPGQPGDGSTGGTGQQPQPRGLASD